VAIKASNDNTCRSTVTVQWHSEGSSPSPERRLAAGSCGRAWRWRCRCSGVVSAGAAWPGWPGRGRLLLGAASDADTAALTEQACGKNGALPARAS